MKRRARFALTTAFGLGLVTPASAAAGNDVVVSASDPDRDDVGPGDYLYPNHPYFFQRGVFDLKAFRIKDGGKDWIFEVEVDLPTPQPVEKRATLARPIQFEQDVFFQNFDIYIQTSSPSAEPEGDERRYHREAVPGRNFRFADGHGWDRAVVITPYPFQLRTLIKDWEPSADTIVPSNVQRIGPRFFTRVRKSEVGPGDPADWRYAVVVTGAVPLVQGYVRSDDVNPNALTMPVRPNPGPDFFGGGDLSRFNPAVIDLLAPTRSRQYEMLKADHPSRRKGPVELELQAFEMK